MNWLEFRAANACYLQAGRLCRSCRSCRTEDLHRFPACQPLVAIQPGGPAMRPEVASEVFESHSEVSTSEKTHLDTWRFISWWFVLFFLKWTPATWKDVLLQAVQCRTWSKWLLFFGPSFRRFYHKSWKPWVLQNVHHSRLGWVGLLTLYEFRFRFGRTSAKNTVFWGDFAAAILDIRWVGAVQFQLITITGTCSRPQIGGPQPASFDFSKKCFGEWAVGDANHFVWSPMVYFSQGKHPKKNTSPNDLRNQSSALGWPTAQSWWTARHVWKGGSGPRIPRSWVGTHCHRADHFNDHKTINHSVLRYPVVWPMRIWPTQIAMEVSHASSPNTPLHLVPLIPSPQ